MTKKIKLAKLDTPIMNAGAGGGPTPAIIIAIIMLARVSFASVSQTTRLILKTA
ncbi:MAG: hypothetical protein ACKVQW_14945 [Pyrinomonadaceae bacterium]